MATFITIIKFLPELFSMIKWISAMLKAGKSELDIKASLKVFDSALTKATETKNTSDLENIFRGKKP
jgi:hypothetical protein